MPSLIVTISILVWPTISVFISTHMESVGRARYLQVVFVMTGDCGNRSHPGFRVYEKIAAASFGQIFHLEKSDVNAVLEYVRYSISQRKVHIMYEVRETGGTVVRVVPVDSYLSELTLSLSGDKDDGDYLDISLIDPSGKRNFSNKHFNNYI